MARRRPPLPSSNLRGSTNLPAFKSSYKPRPYKQILNIPNKQTRYKSVTSNIKNVNSSFGGTNEDEYSLGDVLYGNDPDLQSIGDSKILKRARHLLKLHNYFSETNDNDLNFHRPNIKRQRPRMKPIPQSLKDDSYYDPVNFSIGSIVQDDLSEYQAKYVPFHASPPKVIHKTEGLSKKIVFKSTGADITQPSNKELQDLNELMNYTEITTPFELFDQLNAGSQEVYSEANILELFCDQLFNQEPNEPEIVSEEVKDNPPDTPFTQLYSPPAPFKPQLSVEEGILYALRTGKRPSELGVVDFTKESDENFKEKASWLASRRKQNGGKNWILNA